MATTEWKISMEVWGRSRWELRCNPRYRLGGAWKGFEMEILEGNFATDLCTPTQNPNQLRSSGTLLQTILRVCNGLLAG